MDTVKVNKFCCLQYQESLMSTETQALGSVKAFKLLYMKLMSVSPEQSNRLGSHWLPCI